MWRFAVYTQNASIIRKTCLKTVRKALKHTDGRADYFRFLNNDAASTIRMEKEQPIREVLSLDDFGLLSVNRSQSIDSMSSAGSEHTFLEQLFRNDTLNTFANVQIPTTVSSKELGGSSEVFAHDYVSELLSEGFAADELAEELAGTDSHSYHDDQEPSTSGLEVTELPFLIPELEGKKTRKIMTEKIRRERKLNLSTTTPESLELSEQLEETHLFHVPTESGLGTQTLGEMLFPESIPIESYTSQWKEGESPVATFQEPITPEGTFTSAASTEFSLDILEGIMTEGTMAELKKELEVVGVWPEYLFTGDRRLVSRTNAILRFIVEHSENSEEAERNVSDFVSSHILAVIPDDVLLHLTTKSISESSTMSSIVEKLLTVRSLAVSRELRPNRHFIDSRLTELYRAAVKKCPTTSASLFTLCKELGFDRNADMFMKSYGSIEASSQNFLKSFDDWKKLSTKYGTQQGIDSYWMAALQKDDAGLAKRIQSLLTHSCKSEHPFTTMARMICALNKLDQLDKAFEVFQKVSVSGKHFREPLAEFVKENDLKSIERLATLIERGVIAEKRRGKRVNKTLVEGEVQEKRLFAEKVHEVLAKFYGIGQKKKFVDKKAKRKIHRVDELQLHELCVALQKAWIQCADSQESVERLTRWCELNRVEIDEKVQRRIDSFSK